MAVAGVLQRIGINGPTARIAAHPDLTALDVALLAVKAPADVENLPGWVIASTEQGGGRRNGHRVKPADVCRAIIAGYLTEVGGLRFDSTGHQRLTHNAQGRYLTEGNDRIGVTTE